jgi:colanic acid/amylovoran biosynthesis protein WcaK/AmsJ
VAKIKNIIITGASLSTNYGAQAMSFASIDIIRGMFPYSNISFSTPYYKKDKVFERELSIKVIPRERINQFVKNLLKIIYWGKIRKKKPCDALNINTYLDADLIIDISGDMLTDDYGSKSTIRNFKEFLIPVVIKKTFIIFPQSIGPFKSLFTRSIARFLLNKAKLIIAREKITFENLKELGIKSKIILLPDTAFLLKTINNNKNKEILEKIEKIKSRGKTIIGISISQAIVKFSKTSRSSIGKNMEVDYEKILTNFCDYLTSKLNAKIILIPHVVGPKKSDDDRTICKNIYNKLKNKQDCMILDRNYNSRELKTIIGKCDLFIGSRMHANIAALSQNIPTMSVAYSHKYYGIMQEFMLKDYVIDIVDITEEKIIEMAMSLMKNKDKIIPPMEKKNREIRNKYKKLGDLLKNELSN